MGYLVALEDVVFGGGDIITENYSVDNFVTVVEFDVGVGLATEHSFFNLIFLNK